MSTQLDEKKSPIETTDLQDEKDVDLERKSSGLDEVLNIERGTIVKLISNMVDGSEENDKGTYEIDKVDAYLSKFVQEAFESDPDATEIRAKVEPHILEWIVDYCKRHQGVPAVIPKKPLANKVFAHPSNQIDPKDVLAIELLAATKDEKKERGDFKKTILAANYLDIKCLLHTLCAKCASFVKGTPTEDIPATVVGLENEEHFKTIDEVKDIIAGRTGGESKEAKDGKESDDKESDDE